MDFLAQVIAELATLVTFQQRRTPVPPRGETDEKASRLRSSTRHDAGNGMPEDSNPRDV